MIARVAPANAACCGGAPQPDFKPCCHFRVRWRAALEKLLRDFPGEENGVWRAKGFVRLRDESGVYLVQFTGGIGGGRCHVAPFHQRGGDALVFIDPSLDLETLLRRRAALFWGNAESSASTRKIKGAPISRYAF